MYTIKRNNNNFIIEVDNEKYPCLSMEIVSVGYLLSIIGEGIKVTSPIWKNSKGYIEESNIPIYKFLDTKLIARSIQEKIVHVDYEVESKNKYSKAIKSDVSKYMSFYPSIIIFGRTKIPHKIYGEAYVSALLRLDSLSEPELYTWAANNRSIYGKGTILDTSMGAISTVADTNMSSDSKKDYGLIVDKYIQESSFIYENDSGVERFAKIILEEIIDKNSGSVK